MSDFDIVIRGGTIVNAAGAVWGGGWPNSGKFHFMGWAGSAGASVSSNSSLVLENGDGDGINIITPYDKTSYIYLGSNTANGSSMEGQISFHQSSGLMLKTYHSGASIMFRTSNVNSDRMVIDASGNIGANCF